MSVLIRVCQINHGFGVLFEELMELFIVRQHLTHMLWGDVLLTADVGFHGSQLKDLGFQVLE